MSDLRKAAQMALEALERYQVKRQDFDRFADEITALRAALAQPDIHLPKHRQAIATVFHEDDGRQQIEFITQVPVGELVRLYADPPLYHVDLMNVAVAVRDACHHAWVTSMENWRGDIDLKEIVLSIAQQHKDVGKPAAYAVHQITDDDGVEAWEDIFTSPDMATDTARRLSKTNGQFEVVPLYLVTGVTPCQTCESLARAVMMDQTGTDLRAAIAQPEQVPVAWMVYTFYGKYVCLTDNPANFSDQHEALALYTEPPQRKPLTEDDVYALLDAAREHDRYTLARAIERAHGIE